MYWIKKLEGYFKYVAPELQPEVRAFLDEYYKKKDTHSANITTLLKTLYSLKKKQKLVPNQA